MLYGKDLKEYDNIDLDDLLSQLTDDQIKELGEELIDPDDTDVPPSQRCRYNIEKAPTGPFNRKNLMNYLETTAKEEKDWPEEKPFTAEKRGKVWKPKEQAKILLDDDENVSTEWDEILAGATEEELVDLAAILGFHGMLNQVQYHKAFVVGETKLDSEVDKEEETEEEKAKKKKSGFQGVARAEDLKPVQDEPPNPTNVEDTLNKVMANDPELKIVNLNNIKNLSLSKLKSFAEALKNNTNVEEFSASNTRATDGVASVFSEALQVNKYIKRFNMESNYISASGILSIVESVCKLEVVEELRLANQRPELLGHQTEIRIADLISENPSIIVFGIFLEIPDARVRIHEYLQRNNDRNRMRRVGIEPPPIEKKPKKIYKKRNRGGEEEEEPTEVNGKPEEESEEEED